jgi:hypothetical protein
MNDTVAMFRASRQPGARDLFSCSLSGWRLLQEIAISEGWHPQGTTYYSQSEDVSVLAVHDYEPGGPEDSKRVGSEDAIAWATSLQKAKARPQYLMSVQEPDGAKSNVADQDDVLATLIAEFAQYAYGGSFGFMREEPFRDSKI